MLGRFLEYSIATQDIGASLNFYVKLGFSQAEVGETWSHPYAVVTDGRLCLGLHGTAPDTAGEPALTFIRPGLLKHVDGLEQAGLRFEVRRLGNDVFNELGWRDPSGHLIRLLEARTFSPSKRSVLEMSLCGYFCEIALPTPARETAKTFWELQGFVGMDELDGPLPHVSCTSDTIDIGLYDPADLRTPMLSFETDHFESTIERLSEAGVATTRRLPAPWQSLRAVVLIAPEGTRLLVGEPL